MKKNFNQLSFEQGYQIEALLQTGRSQKEIAQQIGVHPSTICREFRRNTARKDPTAGRYSASDKAFAGHQVTGPALGLETYFTRPYTSQDNGTVRKFKLKTPNQALQEKTVLIT